MNLPKTTTTRRSEPRSVGGAKVKANGAKAGMMPVETSAAAGEAGTFLVVGARLTVVVRKRPMAIVRVRPKADLRADSLARRETAMAVCGSMDLRVVPHTVHLRVDRRDRPKADLRADSLARRETAMAVCGSMDLRVVPHTVHLRVDRRDRPKADLRAASPARRETATAVCGSMDLRMVPHTVRLRVDRTVRLKVDLPVAPHTVRPRVELTAVRTDRHRGRVGLRRADIPEARRTDTVVRHRVDRTVRHPADIVALPRVDIKVLNTSVDRGLATILNSVPTVVSPSTTPVQDIRGTSADNRAILRGIMAAGTTCNMRTTRVIMAAITITFASNAVMPITVTSIMVTPIMVLVTHIIVMHTGVTAIIRKDIQVDEGGRIIPTRRMVAP